MKVLLATDGSDQATTAIRTAARLLRREDTEFDLLCVAPEFYFPKGQAGKTAEKTARMVETYDRRIRAEARRHLIRAQAVSSALQVGEAEITLLSVAETPWVHLGLDREWFEYPADHDDPPLARSSKGELQREANAVVERARRGLERDGLSATVMTSEGDPALEILSEAERGEFDMIVIGATGEDGPRHNFLGSVSTKVTQAALCSTLVVKF
jgi:nucleotide-binding universal stress UspA family protein